MRAGAAASLRAEREPGRRGPAAEDARHPVSLSAQGPLAQLVEHRTFNPRVVGSSPTGPTTHARDAQEALPDSGRASDVRGWGRHHVPLRGGPTAGARTRILPPTPGVWSPPGTRRAYAIARSDGRGSHHLEAVPGDTTRVVSAGPMSTWPMTSGSPVRGVALANPEGFRWPDPNRATSRGIREDLLSLTRDRSNHRRERPRVPHSECPSHGDDARPGLDGGATRACRSAAEQGPGEEEACPRRARCAGGGTCADDAGRHSDQEKSGLRLRRRRSSGNQPERVDTLPRFAPAAEGFPATCAIRTICWSPDPRLRTGRGESRAGPGAAPTPDARSARDVSDAPGA